ncbi:MAG TPA: carboxypeptidase-like regulatory domain-containing protein [Candidatus Acidoferrales bacterium]|nr:carboxypeptidase-like regulatory domain-containing protein [Candidatus Acidoferrales bacterium]
MMSKRILFVLMACMTALCFSPLAFGQAIGSFSGTITDKSGSSIAGASVTVTSQGTGVARETKTDETGHYIVNYLPVGQYTIHVQFQGFQPAEAKDLRLQIDEAREIDFSLNPASVSSTVEVVADAVAVQTTNPTLGQVITSQEVAQLPLNGRDFVQLATLTPGAVAETNPNSFFNSAASSEVSARGPISLSVGGSRANSTDWLLDGNDNNELTSGGIGILASIDAIQEFKVLTYNYSAEFGTRAGPTVLITTKSGTNDFHGTLYEFLRNTSLDAKSFYATKPEKFNLNQYGGSIGGPIRKNKTFFFVDGEQKSQRRGTTFTGLVPSDLMRAGDFSKDVFGNTIGPPVLVPNPNPPPAQIWSIPAGGIFNPNVGVLNGSSTGPSSDPNSAGQNIYFQCDPATGAPLAPDPILLSQPKGASCYKIPSQLFNGSIGQALINLYPHPNANNPNAGINFVNSPVRKLDETKFDIKLDHNFSASDTAFARFSYDQAVSYVPGGAAAGVFAEQNPFGSNQGIQNHGRNVALSETHVFSPTRVNQISGGYNRIFNYITSVGTGSCESSKLMIPGANLGCGPLGGTTCASSSCGLVSIAPTGGYWALGDRGFSPFQGGTNVFSISDSFDMIIGKHDIRIGGSIRANQMNVRAVGFQDGDWSVTGAWTGNPQADLLLGYSSLRIHDQNFNGDVTGRRWKIFRPYFQDDWRATKDLTVNIGLAWSIATPITESANRMSNLVPETGQVLVAGQNLVTDSAGVNMDWRAFEPRIGLAYKLFGSDKTVARAGYSIFHDAAWSQGAQGLWQNIPFAFESFGLQFGGCTTLTAACHVTYGQPANIGTGAAVGFADGFPIITSPPPPSGFFGNYVNENRNLDQGMMQQFNFNIERQLPGQIVLTVGYAGSRAAHILNFGNNINIGSPTACAGGKNATPGYTLGCGPGGASFGPPFLASTFNNTIFNINDFGRAHYNSLQVKAETKSPKYGLYALISYTYSRAYDTGFSDGLGSNIGQDYFPLPGWGKLDWGLSQINLNNSFSASAIYDLPFGRGKKFGSNWSNPVNTLLGGWQLTVIEKITSGFPIFLIDTSNPAGVNFFTNFVAQTRPNQISDPFKPGIVAANPNPQCQVLVSNGGLAPDRLSSSGIYFNPCAFASAPPGQLGTVSRAPLSGPDFVNTDFSVIKRFALPRENMGLDFRAEFFNVFNHAQFGLPGFGVSDVNSPSSFGRINFTVNNPRLVQFALKLNF